MNILYIIKRDPGETEQKIIDSHKQSSNLTVVDIRQDKDYDKIVSLVFSNDKTICV